MARTPSRDSSMTDKAARRKARKAVSAVIASAAFVATPRLVSADPRLTLIDELMRRAEVAVDRSWSGPFTAADAYDSVAQSPISAQNPPPRRYEIAAGALSTVLRTFTNASGLNVTLAIDSLGSLYSPGVTGTLTAEQALTALLDGLGLTFRFTAPDTVTIDLQRLSESVDVTGRAPEVAVSMPKYTQPLREIPQTIEVIPREIMEAQGVTTLSEALRSVPGITMQAGEGGGASNTSGDMFNMRGFNAANSIFVDGGRDDGLIAHDVFNLEQVEVFMGPTGSDVGCSTAAGYVNMETKSPHLPAAHSAQINLGSSDRRRISLDTNAPLRLGTPGSWWSRSAVRLNALWQDTGVPGRDLVELESQGIAPSIAFGLETLTRVMASAQILRQDNAPDYGIPAAAWNEPLTPTTVLAPASVPQSNYYGSPAYDYDKASQQTYAARVEH